METLRLKPRKPVEDDVENWDDDDFLIDGDDLALRNPSAMVSAPPHRRDSLSSHVSVRSELESVQGEEERVVHLPGEDEKSTSHAIAVAATAGIPIPSSVPSTALAGTIKRLGGRKVRKILQEDWGDDLELPDGGEALRIKTQDPSNFPQALRQVSLSHPSPSKPLNSSPVLQPGQPIKTPVQTLGAPINLDRFKDTDDDDDLFGDGSETIKVSKTRRLMKPALTPVTVKMPASRGQADNDYEQDLELPSDGTLKLSSRRDIPKTPVSAHDDFDWGEGSLGTRFGGTRRDGRSNRSSSASAFSPSISSSITAESEDEAQLDGIELPHGPLDLKERLRRKRQNRSPERTIEEEPAPPPPRSVPQPDADTKDFFLDLNVGDGSVFDSGKLKLHTNVKLKSTRPTSPSRPKTAVSLTFTTVAAGHEATWVPGKANDAKIPESTVSNAVPEQGHAAPVAGEDKLPCTVLAPLTCKARLPAPVCTVKPKRAAKKQPQLKPHLIANLNSNNESKMVNGMFYNPETYQWEGNDNALSSFDVPASSPSTVSVPPFSVREKENATPRPALITNISTTKGVQVVGGMVFDPQNMCWLKLGPQSAQSEITDPLDGFNAIDDEDDVFKDIPDLDDNTADTAETGRVSEVKDDWLVGEEFDVGPEFVRRQREEEDRWRKKCERWLGLGNRDREAWRWTIRGVITEATER
ncbi:putative cytokinesis regulator [Diaporthe ampelina]|uniref:Putative cytokinesis regulator n=1 Tax=Diaporthe ampelina TaxID=1214573 RepID=A0A0G2HR59_9PEZI|nr:putative cytokinesis regulator [Diaporthe ampelina]